MCKKVFERQQVETERKTLNKVLKFLIMPNVLLEPKKSTKIDKKSDMQHMLFTTQLHKLLSSEY